ncbi:hypothetical protein AB4114_34505 [Paenibacillus sp. 2RAB27]|uniref:hypothetical protein n=1 Tax=Paenibacillus sp. 2RAB27 TaxID=3232991 RepID=UPI003F972030
MLPHLNIAIKGEDLYAARCAVVHSMKSESRMSKENKATQVLYAYGNNNQEDLQKLIAITEKNYIAIHIDELFKSFRIGIADFILMVIE